MSDQTRSVLLQTEDRKKNTVKEILHKYFSYFPLFIFSLLLSWVISTFYIRTIVPVYSAQTLVMVKNDDKRSMGSSRSNSNDLIDVALGGGAKINIDNEIELIKSKSIVSRVVQDGNFNVRYFIKGKIRQIELYKTCPFKLLILKKGDSSSSFSIDQIDNKGIRIIESQEKKRFIPWNVPFINNNSNYQFVPDSLSNFSNTNKTTYLIKCESISETVDDIVGNLSITPYSSRTTIISLVLHGSNALRNAEILNLLVSTYINVNIEEKNFVANNTINFVNQRLSLITQELTGVESTLQKYRTDQKIVNIVGQTTQSISNSNLNDLAINTLEIKNKVIELLLTYITNPKNDDHLIPGNLGVEDPGISTLINKYNEVILRKQRETPMQAPKSLIIEDFNNQLLETRHAIIEAISLLKSRTQSELLKMQNRNTVVEQQLETIPTKERNLKEIGRQQSIKEGLYLYLLQKREETAITSASTVSSYSQIDKASYSYQMIEPNIGKIKNMSLIIGFLLPIAIIYIIELLNDKVTSREDITKNTDAPIMGEIGHNEYKDIMVVADKSRSVISEQFRIVRTNLQYLMREEKCLLVTSSISGEGKSFISINIAAVLAISGKKVALLEFDLRKPRIIKELGFKQKTSGLSNYLIGQTSNLSDLYFNSELYPTMHIYGCGPVPPNPAELMLSSKMPELFAQLKNEYDYIIIDSAPVGLVSDSFTLNEFTNATLYVIRQRYTNKKQVNFANDIFEGKKLKSMGVIINDVKVGARYGYYGYGTGYGYGYGGYRYGYGNYFEDAQRKSLLKYVLKLWRRIFKK